MLASLTEKRASEAFAISLLDVSFEICKSSFCLARALLGVVFFFCYMNVAVEFLANFLADFVVILDLFVFEVA